MACKKKLSVLLVLVACRLSRIYAFLATPIGEANHHVGAYETAFRTFSIPRQDDSDVGGTHTEEVSLKDIQTQLQTQQEQINKLAKAWASSLQSSTSSGGVTPAAEPPQQLVPPLKAMLFIDGTWLYYSIHERGHDCPLIAQFGRGWQRRYAIDWKILPGIVNRHLMKAVRRFSERPLEIVRSSVFTSYKANTSPNSYRYKLFEDLKDANYDVHMMETVGKSEKCVDIQLAVEMLHHATDSGGSYDIAILLTGDKDFIPAIIRTRQKGKLFSLVSMRAGCNRALVDLPGMRDFDVLWLDDHLDELVIQREQANDAPNAQMPVDEFTLNKVIHDFVQHSGLQKVSSRDLGRYLKDISIGDITVLDAIKEGCGSLYHYLASDEAYIVAHDAQKEDSNFWISLSSDGDRRINELAREAKLSVAEKAFFSSYSTDVLEKAKAEIYTRSLVQGTSYDDSESTMLSGASMPSFVYPASFVAAGTIAEPTISRYDESSTKVDLKEACRDLDLKVSGTKAELLERLREYENQSPGHTAGSGGPVMDDDAFLVATIVEFLRANGGRVGSRNMGRYLAANRGRHAKTALLDLKQKYGTLNSFLGNYPNKFETNFIVGVANEFEIVLK